MHFLLYVPPYSIGSDLGGSHVHLTKTIEKLDKEHEITVICSNSSGFEDTSTEIHEMKSIDIPILYRITLTIYSFMILALLISRRRPDVVYTRNNYHSVISRLVSGFSSTAQVVEINGFAPDEQNLDPKNSLRDLVPFLVWRFVEWSFQYNDHIIAVTGNIKQELQKRYGIPNNKITVINNGADIDLFQPYDITNCRKELDLDLDKTYLCFVGRLSKWQGVQYLIEAIPEIIKSHSRVHLLIVGDGPLRNELEGLVNKLGLKDRVRFVGRVPHERVPIFIGASDVCLVYKVPLDSGYSPLKLYEYMACGRPIVASDLDGFNILDDIGAGTTADPENPTALSKAILELLDSQREEMGINGREYVVQNHSWEQVTEEIVTICGELTNK